MRAMVFVGPTLPTEEAQKHLDAIYLPPAAQGDVYRAAVRRPRAIGLVDGYFEAVPSVWHKEILWALAQGVPVYGSASIGALRAAELAEFGMIGVGTVFEAFRDGQLEGDDEVAVTHGPAELGYVSTCDAMVNVRATLRLAESASIISASTRQRLEAVGKEMFYPERTYRSIIERAAGPGIAGESLAALSRWVPANRVDQKRIDALAMLDRMREDIEKDVRPGAVTYTFQHTDMWDQLVRSAGWLEIGPSAAHGTTFPDRIVEEARLDADAAALYGGAMVRALSVSEASRQGALFDLVSLQGVIDEFRAERQLWQAGDLERWMHEHHLTKGEFTALMKEEAEVRWVKKLAGRRVEVQLVNHLRICGKYPQILARAKAKEQALAAAGLNDPDEAALGISEQQLFAWYFEKELSQQEVALHASSVGYEDIDAFKRAILREFAYQALNQTDNETRHLQRARANP